MKGSLMQFIELSSTSFFGTRIGTISPPHSHHSFHSFISCGLGLEVFLPLTGRLLNHAADFTQRPRLAGCVALARSQDYVVGFFRSVHPHQDEPKTEPNRTSTARERERRERERESTEPAGGVRYVN